MLVALSAAFGASACCLIPLALVSFGIGGAWLGGLTALEPYRWIFVTIAGGALFYGGYREWRLSRSSARTCETGFSALTRRSMLAVAGLAVGALIAGPYVIAPSQSTATPAAGIAAAEDSVRSEGKPRSFRQVVLQVEGMTCPTCPITVRNALKDVAGVYSVEATYRPPEAVVRFDPATTSVKALTRTTTTAGYPSHQARSFE